MEHKLINGTLCASEMLESLKEQVDDLLAQGITPSLVVLLVGNNPSSMVYVSNKARVATQLGISAKIIELPEDITQTKLHHIINHLNTDKSVHAILVQLPLPPHIDKYQIIEAIDPAKDVDGFHPINSGYLTNSINNGFVPCTPLGCMHLIKHTIGKQNIAGKHAVIIGRSSIVGRPLAALLTNHNVTVTLCHSHTKNLENITRNADIVITAVGIPNNFGKEYFSKHSVIIDVGISKIGNRLYGDIEFNEVLPLVKAITPVPGGVGPMTIAYLMHNTIIAAKNSR